MVDKDPQDTEILSVIAHAGDNGIEPQTLIDTLIKRDYDMPSVIEALQRAIERGKIALSVQGMVVAIKREYAHAA
ncbi:hypothetical protein [Sphingobium sp. WCS2017Hpa-17]|uniref:hypothetical protein n=1 Tax=Sphingobium sp. WCS2017Hpa-17 TaxID=3073638 RepID=UPI00288A7180|nr:hypothetical protein [Sphingobium sp. WCS2017Hpa-17]